MIDAFRPDSQDSVEIFFSIFNLNFFPSNPMNPPQPSFGGLGGARCDIRVYPEASAPHEIESIQEPQVSDEIQDIDVSLQNSELLCLSQHYLDQRKGSWEVQPQESTTSEGTQVQLIKWPTASQLSYMLLHPFLYRNLGRLENLNELAELLDAPQNWNEICNRILDHQVITATFFRLKTLPDNATEDTIQATFVSLVVNICTVLELLICTDQGKKIIVGGILSRTEYDFMSKTDPFFVSHDGSPLLATEIKSQQAFPFGDCWYRDCRGVQVFAALYGQNCPTLLLTQQQWKLFVENPSRDSVLTFPFGNDSSESEHVNSTLTKGMGKTLIKTVVICLLSKFSSTSTKTKQSFGAVLETPTVSRKAFRRLDNDFKRLQVTKVPELTTTKKNASKRSICPKPTPKFISGFLGDVPIYSNVRVARQDVVESKERNGRFHTEFVSDGDGGGNGASRPSCPVTDSPLHGPQARSAFP